MGSPFCIIQVLIIILRKGNIESFYAHYYVKNQLQKLDYVSQRFTYPLICDTFI